MQLFLVILTVLSFLLRGTFITTTPPELFGDELDVGYQAYSLYKTGRDLYNQPLPTYIHSLSEWRMPLLIYSTVPTVALFGLTESGVRGPEVAFGVIAPLLLYVLVYQLTRNKYLAAGCALALTFLPWHIHYSRAAFEVVILINLILVGVLTFIRRWYVLSSLFFVLTLYTYSTALVFVPLFVLALLFLYRPRWTKLLLPSVVGLVLLLPLIQSIFTGSATSRFNSLSILRDPNLVDQITKNRQIDPSPLSQLWYNKGEMLTRTFLSNYFRAFSADFLFVRGDPIMRHSLQYVGHLIPLTAPLLLLGLYHLVKSRQWLWLIWLLLAPLPASLTSDGAFHATRLFLLTPPLAVALGYGLVALFHFPRPRLTRPLALLFLTVVLVQFVYLGHYYLVRYPQESWRWWHYGYKSILTQATKTPGYSRFFVNNTYEPSLIRYLFYSAYSPEKFHRNFTLDQPKPDIFPGYDGFALDDQVFFGTFSATAKREGIEKYLLPGSMYLISQRDDVGGDWDWRTSPPSGVQVISTTTDPFGAPLFYLVSKHD